MHLAATVTVTVTVTVTSAAACQWATQRGHRGAVQRSAKWQGGERGGRSSWTLMSEAGGEAQSTAEQRRAGAIDALLP